jgi:succinate-semialdehyde dehydrogenase/glutarate-semialdehyde dehydrogenase
MSIELLNDPSLWRQGALINGEWVEQTPHGKYAVRNPANGEVLVELPVCKEAQAEFAIESAHEAFTRWSKVPAKQRADIIHQWYRLVVEHKEDLATLITLEEGKPLSEARGEIDYAASFLQWFAEEAKRVRGG